MDQKLNAAGLELIKRHEALRLRAYQDSVGVWTIGWGHTRGVARGDIITEPQAEDLLRQDLAVAEAAVNRLGQQVPLNPNQFAALVSLVFNCGAGAIEGSTLGRCLLRGDFPGAASQFPEWCHGKVGGKTVVLAELVNRRAEERALFMRLNEMV